MGMGASGREGHRPARHPGRRPRTGRRPVPSEGLTGRIDLSRRGGGEVETGEGRFWVPPSKVHGALTGDMVRIRPLHGARKAVESGAELPRGSVVEVLERANDQVVGRFEKAGPLGVAVPFDPRVTFDVFLAPPLDPSLAEGDVVRVRITTFPSRSESALGQVEEVLGHEGDRSLELRLLMQSFGLDQGFGEDVEREAAGLSLDVEAALTDPGRRDLRHRHILTIDPASARDFDDALSLEREGDVWHLGVHIADVSAYVRPGTALDREALRRGTSVYLGTSVVPMLPARLSDELCSLVPGDDRLAFTVDLAIDGGGGVLATSCYPSVIRSGLRLDYDFVQEMLDGARAWVAYPDGTSAQGQLEGLRDLAQLLRKRRLALGGVDLATREPLIECAPDGTVTEVGLRQRTEATGLVEEAMILANTQVAQLLTGAHAPFVRRVHPRPKAASLAELALTLEELGFDHRSVEQGDPLALQRAVAEAQGTPEEELVSLLVLRSMQRASYDAGAGGHYGLGLADYCHFTSPIRRYPDLVVHRALKAHLAGAQLPEEQARALPEVAEHCSRKEREADEAERAADEMLLTSYLADRVGEQFSGVVSGISRDGVFVRLDFTAEGLVPSASLPLGLRYNPDRQALEDDRGRPCQALGQRVQVRVEEVLPARRMVRFSLVSGGKR